MTVIQSKVTLFMHMGAMEVGEVQVIAYTHVTLYIRVKGLHLQRHIQGLGLWEAH